MGNTSLVSRPMTKIIFISLVTLIWVARSTPSMAAAYLLSQGAGEAESQIVLDVQKGRLDPSNLAPGVADKLFQFIRDPKPPSPVPQPMPAAPGPPTSAVKPSASPEPLLTMVLQSPLQKICPVLSVRNPYGLQYSFRSLHRLGKLDWIVTASVSIPETITTISVMQIGKLPPLPMPGSPRLPNGAPQPPAMLPIVPSNSRSDIIPSVEMGCLSVAELRAAQKERLESCKKVRGAYCGEGRK
jgi:hypothetical protein